MDHLSEFLLQDYKQCGNQTDLFTYICYQDFKAEIISEVISYILHAVIFTLFFIWVMLKNYLF